MRLYHHPFSSNARRATMTAIHLGIKLELVEINLGRPDDRRRLSELTLNGKIPVLEDDGFMLWESCAIMQYLADSMPRQGVYPREPHERADVNRWMFWASQHFSPAVSVLAWENVWKKIVEGTDPDPVELARGNRELAQYAAVLDGHLANREWLAGEAVTLADYATAAPLMYMQSARLPLGQYRHLLAWFDRVQQLEAWRQTDPVW
jgi:glutathione S-transferase